MYHTQLGAPVNTQAQAKYGDNATALALMETLGLTHRRLSGQSHVDAAKVGSRRRWSGEDRAGLVGRDARYCAVEIGDNG